MYLSNALSAPHMTLTAFSFLHVWPATENYLLSPKTCLTTYINMQWNSLEYMTCSCILAGRSIFDPKQTLLLLVFRTPSARKETLSGLHPSWHQFNSTSICFPYMNSMKKGSPPLLDVIIFPICWLEMKCLKQYWLLIKFSIRIRVMN